jgi:hypothetical protein
VWEEEEKSLRRNWGDLFPGLALARVMKTVLTGGHMEEVELKQQLRLLQQQVEAVASLLEETKLSLVSRIDMVGLEVEVLRRFLRHAHADFPRRYPTLREEVVREVDPEWTETPAETKP